VRTHYGRWELFPHRDKTTGYLVLVKAGNKPVAVEASDALLKRQYQDQIDADRLKPKKSLTVPLPNVPKCHRFRRAMRTPGLDGIARLAPDSQFSRSFHGAVFFFLAPQIGHLSGASPPPCGRTPRRHEWPLLEDSLPFLHCLGRFGIELVMNLLNRHRIFE